MSDAETKLKSFVEFCLQKLDSAEAELTDEDPEDNYGEQCDFMTGLSRNLKNVGAAASADLRAKIRAELMSIWDIATDKAGPDLRAGGVAGIRTALNKVLDGPLKTAAPPVDAVQKVELPSNIKTMDFQSAVTYMWTDLDKKNRCEYGDDGFTLDMQGKGKFDGRDAAKNPLFSWVDEKNKFWTRKTTTTFIALLDNYVRELGKAETISNEEKKEMSDFMAALGATSVFQFAFQWLKIHGKDARCKKLSTMQSFLDLVYDLWLAPYRRVVENDSSGFEHVFVGEEKDGKITGLHNWIQYYIEEKKGKIDYLGWAGKQDSDYNDDVNIVTVKFAWNDDDPDAEVKPMSTMLCGCTVEFEMAMLTMAFLAGAQEGDTPLQLGNEKCKVTCYPQKTKFGTKIATAFLEIER